MLLMFPTGTLDRNQLLFAVAAYNFANFMVKEFDLSFEEAGPMSMLTIHGFFNLDEILHYYKMIYGADGYATALDKNVAILPISDDNYETLMRGKTLEEYVEFFQENFGEAVPEPVSYTHLDVYKRQLNALSYSPYEIRNLSDCDDTEVMVKALNSNDRDFDIKAAGTAMRFLTAFLSKVVGEWTITGTQRMKNRPIKILVDALNSLGARVEYMEKEGYPPLRIFGSALQGGEVSLAGGVSSQYISALLMIAPLMENGLTLHLEGAVISKPYINLTLQLMEQYGVKAEWNGQTIKVRPQAYLSLIHI